MPGEAVTILYKVECHLGWEISCEEIKQGQLQKLLIVDDDYTAPSEVSGLHPTQFY